MNYTEERRAKVYKKMLHLGMEKALVGDPISINYLTGISVTPHERFYGILLDAKKQTSVMIVPSVDRGCMKEVIPECIYTDSDGPLETIKALLAHTRELAIDMGYYTMSVGNMLGKLNVRLVETGQLVTALRMYKDQSEIDKMQRAADIVNEALEYVKCKVKPGMTEKELNFMLYSYMAKVPGVITDQFIILVQGGVNSAQPHGVSGDYKIKAGDIILMDFCAYYDYYWSDMTRCLFLGSPKESQLAEIYEIVKGANQAAIDAVKPGVKASEVDQAARNYIEQRGYGEYFIHRTGHGLGLSVHEEPYITSVNDLILEEGMVFTIEPGIYLKGIGGVRIEDDVLVTSQGVKVLTTASKEMQDHIVKV